VARTEDQATWISVFFTMATVMLGGTFFEIPEGSTLFILSQGSINTYVNSALRTIIAGEGTLINVTFELVVLTAVTIAALVISRILFKAVPGGR
jgi:hypothetical protein